jgi:hypothetical protein
LSEHTCELKPSQEDAERVVERLRQGGWEIYNERVPLSGQFGYYCVRLVPQEQGGLMQQVHSVRWNLFGDPLVPLTIECLDDTTLLSFLWQHISHENFSFFEYDEGDVGFVCYCHGEHGYSLVLRVSDEDTSLSDVARDVVVSCVAKSHDDDD